MSKRLQNKRDQCILIVHNILQFSEELNSETAEDDITVRTEKLDALWTDFFDIESEICPTLPSKESEFCKMFYKSKSLLSKFFKEHFGHRIPKNESTDVLKHLIQQQKEFFQGFSNHSSLLDQSLLNMTRVQDSVRLPKINIEPFKGDYASWPTFFDLFNCSVHLNGNLSNVHKFQILKGLLRDTASDILEGMNITEDNYNLAYDKLKKRFDKKRPIVNELISSFLNQNSAVDGTVKSLRRLCDFSDKIINGLKSLGANAEKRDPWLIQLLMRKLDVETQEQWSLSIGNEDFPTFEQFLNFLSSRCDARETSVIVSNKSYTSKIKSFHTSQTLNSTFVCPNCNLQHSLNRCFKFKKMPIHQRHAFVKQQSLCFNCLRSDHSAENCPIEYSCRICHQRHHSLIHLDPKPNSENQLRCHQTSSESNQSPTPVPCSILHSATPPLLSSKNLKSASSNEPNSQAYNAITSRHTLLPTALIYVRDSSGHDHLARALIDSASTTSFISDSLVQRLRLRRTHCTRSISGIGNTPAGTSSGRVHLTLISRVEPDCKIELNALILKRITSVMPSVPIGSHDLSKLKNLQLADPNFGQPAAIDILIGAERALVCLTGQKLSISTNLMAFSSMFGWIVGGETVDASAHCSFHVSDEDLNSVLQKFWHMEEIPETDISLNSVIENHYMSNVIHDGDRYSVKLPFVEERLTFGDSKRSAFSRLFAMERRFKKDSKLKEKYCEFMDEYLQLGHMYLTPKEEIDLPDDQCYYLPHHCVTKSESSTSKIRVVFDGSCCTSSGISLNQNLLVGPTIQEDLFTILVRFRLYPIAYSADIEKMYRQVLVHREDHQYQRILWRKHQKDPICHYNLKTITYGTSCAPYLAIRTLHKIADDLPKLPPTVKRAIKSDFYVDDVLAGGETIETISSHIFEISKALEFGGFRLRKWKTNSRLLLSKIPEDDRDPDNLKLFDESLSAVKTLGILWNPLKDVFTFQIASDESVILTKRTLLSQIAKVYDPIGWIAPVTVSMKMLFQKTWLSELRWDDPISASIGKEWYQIRNEFHLLKNLDIPRHLLYSSAIKSCQLHAFCDASELAYGVVTYLRTESQNGNVNIRILAAKTRVAPIKKVTLPRLELAGAALLAELVQYLKRVLQIENLSVKCWCDSQIVLAWLSSKPSRWKPFIANRTSRILNIIPRYDWNYIRSKENPADAASRGLSPSNLLNNKLWWQGPEWLTYREDKWPNTSVENKCTPTADLEERAYEAIVVYQTIVTSNDTLEYILDRFSKYGTMIRVLSWVIYMRPSMRNCDYSKRLVVSENLLLQYIQNQSFPLEIRHIKDHKPIPKSSKLISLFPYLDEEGLLRVGGRLQEADMSVNQRHPIILPHNHSLARIITRDTHLQHLHCGPSLLNSLLKQKFWIIDGKNLARSVYNSCVRCFRFRQQSKSQLMANLPYARVTPSRPFLHTGIDFAGPIDIKARKGRGNIPILKGYVAIFVCFSTKATHIEIVSDLSAEAYIAALRRFIGRRGAPMNISTDNGTNFVGGSNELKKLSALVQSQLNQPVIENFFSQQAIQHSFIPARSPHFGGLWEANIKSIKFHLRRVTNAPMTYEDFATLLIQIEGLLNSRPLCPMSEDIHDLSVLTPGHFLIGAPLTSLPQPNLDHIAQSRLSHWQDIQARVHSFWKKWSLEYLHTKQQRYKWCHDESNIKVGELVIVKEENIPPSKWLLARISKVHPGKDKRVRVATIKTKTGELQRPIVKLCRLPFDNEDAQQE